MSRVLVTGATGFVGRALCAELLLRGHPVCAALRRVEDRSRLPLEGIETFVTGTVNAATDWRNTLAGCTTVVHLAARVHVMRDKVSDPLTAFRRVNVDGTLNLARQASAAGVRRFVFISSIKVNGETTRWGHPFIADDVPDPQDPYSISKHEAEMGLCQIAAETQMEMVIIRPSLIYGPDVKANFQKMMQWLHRGIPLPLGAIHNKRSLISLANLVDLIIICLDHQAAAHQIFLAADGEDLSTTELLRRMGMALGRPARLIPVPTFLLEFGAALLGRGNIAQRLCESLQVDISKARTRLGWNPPISVDEGLRRTAQSFLYEKDF